MMFICIPCGYIHNEEKTGQLWAELPEDWACPDCQGSREQFAEFSVTQRKDEIAQIVKSYEI